MTEYPNWWEPSVWSLYFHTVLEMSAFTSFYDLSHILQKAQVGEYEEWRYGTDEVISVSSTAS